MDRKVNPVKVVIDSIIAPAEIANENSPTPSKPLLDNVILLIKKKNNDAVIVAKTDFLDKIKRLLNMVLDLMKINFLIFLLNNKEYYFYYF